MFVHVHKAPTDEAIKFYEEIKQKAFDSIIDTIIINDNKFNCKAILYKDIHSFQYVIKFKYTINGKAFSDSIQVTNIDRNNIIKKIYESISSCIANKLLSSLDINWKSL